MLIQNSDRTTYGINKVFVLLFSFLTFSAVEWVSWELSAKETYPYEKRLMILVPLTMSLLLYFCCDQLGVYRRCITLKTNIYRFIKAYVFFLAFGWMIWQFLVPYDRDPFQMAVGYILTFFVLLGLKIYKFQMERKQETSIPVLIVGTKQETDTFSVNLKKELDYAPEKVHYIKPEEISHSYVTDLLIRYNIGKVVFLPENTDTSYAKCLVDICGKMGVDFYAPMLVKMQTPHKTYFGLQGGLRMLVYKSSPIRFTSAWQLKKLMDIGGAALLLLLTSPLWLLAAVGIKLSDRGPVFYRQKRSGIYGKEFGMWKFRTMYTDADKRLDEIKAKYGNDMDGPIFKLKDDPRIFGFGHFLRKFSIDELPQLINVLKGEMSLVGPRPLPIYETVAFTSFSHRRRLSVLPGVTGYWQIAGRSDITDFEQLVALDLQYIDHWSIPLDILLLIKTVPAVLFAKGAR